MNIQSTARIDARLAAGVRDDLAACARMIELLEEQFAAALRHRTTDLEALLPQLEILLASMEHRRRERVQLVHSRCGSGSKMAHALSSIGCAALTADWTSLERLVLECLQLEQRNRDLLAGQFQMMQRVLHGEDPLYGPG